MWADAQRDGRPAQYRPRWRLCSAPQSLADAAAGVPCSRPTSANIGERKIWTHVAKFHQGAIAPPPKMYIWCTSSGDGQTSCKVWWASGERRRCSNEGNTRNPLKFAGLPKLPNRSQPLVGRSSHIVGTSGEDIAV